jgi:hypothetical protein
MQREQMAPKIIQTQRESSLRGSMQTSSEPDLGESQLTQRKTRSFIGSSLSDSSGRERCLPVLADRWHKLRRLNRSFICFEDM